MTIWDESGAECVHLGGDGTLKIDWPKVEAIAKDDPNGHRMTVIVARLLVAVRDGK